MAKRLTIRNDILLEEVRRLVLEGHSVTITAKGGSMNPFIRNMKDQVVLSPFKPEEIVVGAVVLVLDTRGSYVLHRIIAVDEASRTITLMGDGNIGLTETAGKDNIIGLMTAVIKGKSARQYSTKGRVWRIYSSLWKFLTPIRRYPLGLWRLIFNH